MTEIDFLISLFTHCVTFFFGSLYGINIWKNHIEKQKFKKYVDGTVKKSDKVDGEIIKSVSMPACLLRVEEVNGMMLFYDTSDDSFVCQGNSLDESAKNFCIATKNQAVGIFTVNNKRFVFHDSECLPTGD